MHEASKNFYEKIVNNRILLSAAMRKSKDNLRMGVPIMFVLSDPNSTIDMTQKKKKSMSELYTNTSKLQTTESSLAQLKELKVLLSKDKPEISDVNELLKEMYRSGTALIPFPLTSALIPTTINLQTGDIFYNGKPPIIREPGLVIKSDGCLSSERFPFTSRENTQSSVEAIFKLLNDERFVNISVSNMISSYYKAISTELKLLINTLADVFKYSESVYNYGSGRRTLLDTVSVSFYRLDDVIPTFCGNSTQGLCIELFTFNSVESKTGTFLKGVCNCSMVHMVFATDAEGIKHIDGEVLQKGYSEKPSNDLSRFMDTLHNNVPSGAVNKKQFSTIE